MAKKIEARLKELNLTLPEPPRSVASYVPYVVTGNLVYVSGQVPTTAEGLRYPGKVGQDVSLEDGKAAARICAINVLAQLKQAVNGDLDRVRRCVKLTVFVNAVPGFANHPEVANGVSDLLLAVFDDAGRHSRSSVGSNSLPRNVSVEVDGIFEIA